jgi:hypothetical protein
MTNASSALDYDKISERMAAAEDHILARTKKMLKRVLDQESE